VQRWRVQSLPARDVTTSVVAGLLLIWAITATVRAPSTPPPRIHGAYRITFAGAVSGTGKAVVTPKSVKIDADVIDDQGARVAFSATDLQMDGSAYRFRGFAALGGLSVQVAGRVDPGDSNVGKCRITATFLTYDGKGGRIAGSHN